MQLSSIVFCTDGSSDFDELYSTLTWRNEGIPLKTALCDEMAQYLESVSPSGVILPITERMIENASFGECVKAITEYMNAATGTSFRCFVYPVSISYDLFLEACEGKSDAIHLNEGLALIQENIHHAPFGGPDDLFKEVARFEANAGNVRNYYSAVHLKLDLQTVIGNLMQVAAVASHIITVVLGLLFLEKFCAKIFPSILLPLHDRAMALLDTKYLPIIMLAFAICLIFCVTNILYWFKGGSGELANRVGTGGAAKAVFAYCYLLPIPIISFFYLIYKEHWRLLLLCIAAGIVVDVLRRCRYSVKRGRIALSRVGNNYDDRVDPRLLKVRSRFVGAPYRVPWLTRERKPVFISYTHSSKWSSNTASDLYDELTKHGLPCFLDKHDIMRGSSWHKRLIEKMGEASQIICLVDDISIDKAWPAEELQTALKLRRISGDPTIYLLVKQGLRTAELKKTTIFEEVLNKAGDLEEIAVVLKETGDSASLMASNLKQGHDQANSLFGYTGSVVLDNLIRRPFNVLTLTCISILWLPLLIAGAVNWRLHFFEDMLEHGGTPVWICLVAACYVCVVCLIDVVVRPYMYNPGTEEKSALSGRFPALAAAFISGWVLSLCVQSIQIDYTLGLFIFIAVGIAGCSISACHENMLRNGTIRYGNEY
ncbi:MAG: toll/interleukin-1 receptor domain-containing protein [Clostridiales Family XIII bacterium]|jgi:hypothetical protein|nr:toll/interleukin-1 receptor domain-containing protein [Clostridiales Family XIII bacterium]